ncbi:hypothetical protein HOY80DRAFT_115624 [Tuber brumale]|nr:hypothetical protein HOY80DRAFT_115624 [Tuber brumale]
MISWVFFFSISMFRKGFLLFCALLVFFACRMEVLCSREGRSRTALWISSGEFPSCPLYYRVFLLASPASIVTFGYVETTFSGVRLLRFIGN